MESENKETEVERFYRDFRKDEALARLSHSNSFFHSLIRSLILVNGAAIIALFTFIGSENPTFESRCIWSAFVCFALGVFSAILATWGHGAGESKWWSLSYVEMLEIDYIDPGTPDWDKRKIRKSGRNLQVLTLIAYGLSVLAFIIGSYFALRGVMQ